MKTFTTLIAAAAFVTLPSAAFAQVSTDALTDKVKDKAVDTVMDNMTTDDAITAGKTILKGGSKEDAAMAVVKGRAEDKVESMTGTKVDLDDLSKDGMKDAGKDVVMDKAKGSATKYMDKSSNATSTTLSKDGVMDAGKAMAADKAKSSATTYTDKSKGSASTYSEKKKSSSTTYTDKAKGSAATYSDKSKGSATSYEAPATQAPKVVCPAGTKDAGNGTCMVTGDWKY